MAPTSRGLSLLRSPIRTPPLRPQFHQPRHVTSSFRKPLKLPPRQPKSIPKPETIEPPPKPPGRTRLLARLHGNAAFNTTLRILPWLPIIVVIYHHSPLALYPIEGPSMAPTFNPNYTSEAGTMNSRTDVLVLKQEFTHTWLSAFIRSCLPRPRPPHPDSKRPDPSLQRGQIVVYRTPHDPDRIGVKRVVGLAGDRVTPLPGYPGGDSPVLIPYNHLWLEGDSGDRKLSADSNYFGPASANLVLGRVLCQVPSLYPWFTGTRWEDGTYPARRQGRVEANAVRARDPDEELAARAWRNGQMRESLATVKAYPMARPLSPMERQQWDDLHRVSYREKERRDTETYALADELEAELRKKLYVRQVTETLKNVEMSREELAAFRRDGVVPESVLVRSKTEG